MEKDYDEKTAVELLNLGADVVQFLRPRKLTIGEARTVLRRAEALLDTVPLPAPEEPEPEPESDRAEALLDTVPLPDPEEPEPEPESDRAAIVAQICMLAATLCTLAVTLYRLFAR